MAMRCAAGFIVALAMAGNGAYAAPDQNAVKQAFFASCQQRILRAQPSAAAWVEAECRRWWQQVEAAAPMAEAIFALAPAAGAAPVSRRQLRAASSGVQWTGAAEGRLGGLHVHLAERGAGIGFRWQQIGAEVHYDVIEALRLRGAELRTLGCPQYAGASLGSEQVSLVSLPGKTPFTLSVYLRPAPTGFSPAVYEVDADFSGSLPDLVALRAGRYPGGGGRAFAGQPISWTVDCGPGVQGY